METKPAVTDKSIADKVLARVNDFQKANALTLPKDYSAENALKSAYLMLQETVDRNNKPVLESCTQVSVANCLFDMVIQGLSPIKKQCYFIAYGSKLLCQRSYQGAVAVAKRVGMKSIVANPIYEGDTFKYEILTETGRKRLIEHVQEIENIDLKKIKGAYAITEMEDGTRDLEVMNMLQIRNAWNQGAAKGNSGAHNNFTDEMCCKTIIQRACKDIINSSDDSHLFGEEDEKDPIKEEVANNANKEAISFEDVVAEEVVETPVPEAGIQPSTEEVKKEETKKIPGF